MNSRAGGWTDERMEGIMGTLLRAGVLIAAAFVLTGGVIYLVRHGMSQPQYGVFAGEPAELRTLPGIIRAVLSWRGRGIIQLGLLILIATPVARVLFAVFGFAKEHDKVYVAVSLLVLTVLVLSLAGVHL